MADFPLMNLYHLIQVALSLKDKDASYLRETDPEVFRLGLAHIKIFFDNYYECLALTDVELATTKGLTVKVSKELPLTQPELKKYAGGEICLKPFVLVFAGKDKNGKSKRFLFQASEVERYTKSQYTIFIDRMNNYKKNNEGDKKELKKIISWYTEIQRVMLYAIQILFN